MEYFTERKGFDESLVAIVITCLFSGEAGVSTKCHSVKQTEPNNEEN